MHAYVNTHTQRRREGRRERTTCKFIFTLISMLNALTLYTVKGRVLVNTAYIISGYR